MSSRYNPSLGLTSFAGSNTVLTDALVQPVLGETT
jgi:hypothetical protein